MNRSRHLLLIGDEGAALLSSSGKITRSTGHDETAARPILKALVETPHRPVLVLANTSGVKIRLDNLPPLPWHDRCKLIERRVQKFLNGAHLHTSVMLGSKQALLAGIDSEGAVASWLDQLAKLPNTLSGVALLPLEMTKFWAHLLGEKSRGWTLLLVESATSGLRQIALHDHQIVFTRISPASPQNLEADIQAVRHYLNRLGMPQTTPLRLEALVSDRLSKVMAGLQTDAGPCRTLTERIASDKLGHIPPDGENIDIDALLLGWCAKRSTSLRTIRPEAERTRHRIQQTRRIGLALASAALGLALIHAGLAAHSLLGKRNQIHQLQAAVAQIEGQWRTTQETIAPAGEPLGRLRQAIERRRLFNAKLDNFESLWPQLDEAMRGEARAVTVEIQEGTLMLDLALTNEGSQRSLITAQQADWVQRFDALAERLREALPGYYVTIARYPFPNLPNETLSNADKALHEPVARFLVYKEDA